VYATIKEAIGCGSITASAKVPAAAPMKKNPIIPATRKYVRGIFSVLGSSPFPGNKRDRSASLIKIPFKRNDTELPQIPAHNVSADSNIE
jgi:hypothetical protein